MSAGLAPALRLDERHQYFVGNEKLPSLSHFLRCGGLGEDFVGVNPAILEHAALRGTRVHQAAEILVRGQELDQASVWEEIEPYVDAFRQYMADEKPDLLMAEEPIFHGELRYACTPDLVLTDGSCVEYKATAKIPKFIGYQLAGQGMCLDSMFQSKPRAHHVLWLKKNGTYQLREERQTPEDEHAVAGALAVCRGKDARGLHQKK